VPSLYLASIAHVLRQFHLICRVHFDLKQIFSFLQIIFTADACINVWHYVQFRTWLRGAVFDFQWNIAHCCITTFGKLFTLPLMPNTIIWYQHKSWDCNSQVEEVWSTICYAGCKLHPKSEATVRSLLTWLNPL